QETMAHELKAGLKCSRCDPRIAVADIGIQCQRHRYPAVGQRLELPPESCAHSVFMPGPVRYVRQKRLPHRGAQHGTWHCVLDPPLLDIENDPHCEFLAAGECQSWPVDLCLIGDAIAESHGEFLG